jgi:hypothetical protein
MFNRGNVVEEVNNNDDDVIEVPDKARENQNRLRKEVRSIDRIPSHIG